VAKQCDLDHPTPKAAVIRVVVRSNRVDKPGRPMIRDLNVCNAHAKQIRALGIDVVSP
jgi:hypothetical protein